MMRTVSQADATDTDLATRLRLAVMRLSRRLRHESAADGVTPSMHSALSAVERLGPSPIPIGDLAAAEQVSPPAMTRIVDHLEARGLVARRVDPSDRRVTLLALTPAGTRTLAGMRSRKNAFLAERLAALSEDERSLVRAAAPILERLAADAGERR
jgi:DNA-binding MarR family transcriptional regulator